MGRPTVPDSIETLQSPRLLRSYTKRVREDRLTVNRSEMVEVKERAASLIVISFS